MASTTHRHHARDRANDAPDSAGRSANLRSASASIRSRCCGVFAMMLAKFTQVRFFDTDLGESAPEHDLGQRVAVPPAIRLARGVITDNTVTPARRGIRLRNGLPLASANSSNVSPLVRTRSRNPFVAAGIASHPDRKHEHEVIGFQQTPLVVGDHGINHPASTPCPQIVGGHRGIEPVGGQIDHVDLMPGRSRAANRRSRGGSGKAPTMRHIVGRSTRQLPPA